MSHTSRCEHVRPPVTSPSTAPDRPGDRSDQLMRSGTLIAAIHNVPAATLARSAVAQVLIVDDHPAFPPNSQPKASFSEVADGATLRAVSCGISLLQLPISPVNFNGHDLYLIMLGPRIQTTSALSPRALSPARRSPPSSVERDGVAAGLVGLAVWSGIAELVPAGLITSCLHILVEPEHGGGHAYLSRNFPRSTCRHRLVRRLLPSAPLYTRQAPSVKPFCSSSSRPSNEAPHPWRFSSSTKLCLWLRRAHTVALG